MNCVVLALVGTFFVFSKLALAAPSCADIIQDMLPCLPYINHTQPQPSSDCCQGVRELSPYAGTKNDRVAICQCLIGYAPEVGIVDFSLIPSIPNKCHVSLELPPITKNMNCSRI